MDVSIIIVNYNTCELLHNCLYSIYKYTQDIEFEVIVVDNDSKDNSRSMLANEFPNVALITNQENLGFGKANNIGIKHSRGKYLFFLNSDTLLLNNAIRIFYDYCNENPNERIGALGTILKSIDGENIHSYGHFITLGSELKGVIAKYLRFLKDRKIHHPDDVVTAKEVDYITGADLFVPRNVYEELGGFDPRFFMYCEEVDWQHRMAEAGYKRIIIPGPEIVHLEGGSDTSQSNIWSANRLKHIYKSKRLYLEKYNKGVKYRMFRIANIMLRTPIILMLIITKNGGGTKRC
ncbi:glycosyltransferase family 2 protein [Bacteroides sp.]|uniref:glycosyltransferase family 2 protein n=1 Tax=Bacteroides sp. TaxID=29523 RepID=UPI003AB14A5F